MASTISQYLPETRDTSDYLAVLGDQQAEWHVLGSEMGAEAAAGGIIYNGNDLVFNALWLLGTATVAGFLIAFHLKDDDDNVEPLAAPTVEVSDSGLVISGRSEPNVDIQVELPSGQIINTQTDADGNYSVTLDAPFTDGMVTVTASRDGQTASTDVTLDTAPPDTPTTAPFADDNVGSVQGPINDGDSTDDTLPEFTGTGTPGDTITLYDGTTAVGTAVVAVDGTWSVTPDAPLAEGDHDLGYSITDPAGNESGISPPLSFTVDTTAPTTPIAPPNALDDQGAVTGPINDGDSTDDTLPEFTGTGTPGDTITLYDGATAVGTTQVLADGTWSVTPDAPLAEGDHDLGYSITDPAGNESGISPPLSFTVDTTAPTTPIAIVSYTDDVGANQGNFSNGTSTDDLAPTLNGTLGSILGAGEFVEVFRDGVLLGNASVTGTSFTFSDTGLSDGNTYVYTAQINNAAGNPGTPSANFTLIADTTAPLTLSLIHI